MKDTTPQEKDDPRLAYGQLAMLGVGLLMTAVMWPYLGGDAMGSEGYGMAPGPRMVYQHIEWISRVSWLGVGCVASSVAYAVILSRRIPRKVVERRRAHTARELAHPHRENVLGQNGLFE